jgi:hypothetical protein
LVGQAVKGECRHESDHALGRAHGGFGKDLAFLDLCAMLLINPARDPFDLATLHGACDGLRTDAGIAQVLRAHQVACVEQVAELRLL